MRAEINVMLRLLIEKYALHKRVLTINLLSVLGPIFNHNKPKFLNHLLSDKFSHVCYVTRPQGRDKWIKIEQSNKQHFLSRLLSDKSSQDHQNTCPADSETCVLSSLIISNHNKSHFSSQRTVYPKAAKRSIPCAPLLSLNGSTHRSSRTPC